MFVFVTLYTLYLIVILKIFFLVLRRKKKDRILSLLVEISGGFMKDGFQRYSTDNLLLLENAVSYNSESQ